MSLTSGVSMTCTSIERGNMCCSRLGNGSLHTKRPALPEGLSCFQSNSSTKSSYIRAVRRKPVGEPVQCSMPSRAWNVSSKQLTRTQPSRSLPLKSGCGATLDHEPPTGWRRSQPKTGARRHAPIAADAATSVRAGRASARSVIPRMRRMLVTAPA